MGSNNGFHASCDSSLREGESSPKTKNLQVLNLKVSVIPLGFAPSAKISV